MKFMRYTAGYTKRDYRHNNYVIMELHKPAGMLNLWLTAPKGTIPMN